VFEDLPKLSRDTFEVFSQNNLQSDQFGDRIMLLLPVVGQLIQQSRGSVSGVAVSAITNTEQI